MSAFDKNQVKEQIDTILIHSDGSLQIELQHTGYFELLPNWVYLCNGLYGIISLYAYLSKEGGFIITDREVQIEALWTYEISTEKILWRAVKKGFITQSEADEFSENLFEQLDTKKISGFHPSPLREKMCAEDVRVNPYVSMTEIAWEKKISRPSYLIQNWMRSNATIEYLRMWEKIYNPQFQESSCDELIHTVHTTGTTLTP